jgi:alpha-L-fucosidase
MVTSNDAIIFPLEVQDAGDYKVILDYACEPASASQEGAVTLLGQRLPFLTLQTGIADSHKPMMFIQHAVGIIHIAAARKQNLAIRPGPGNKQALFQLRKIILQPVK